MLTPADRTARLAERVDRFQTFASDAHAAGFANEAKRKDALADVNTAWEALRSVVTDALLADDPEARTDAWHDLYDAFPYYPHLWTPKLAAKYAGRWPNEAARATSLRALRDGIKGAELRAKVKVKTAAQVAKEAAQMTCQICGRGIFAEAGVIAHHGYERPFEGYQTASCPGARKLPFEVDRSLLAREIAMLEDAVAKADQHVADLDAERAPLFVSWETKEENPNWRALPASKRLLVSHYVKATRSVTRETFDAVDAEHRESNRHGAYSQLAGGRGFEGLKANALRTARQRLQQLLDTLKLQQARYDGWKQTHRAGGAGELTWVAL